LEGVSTRKLSSIARDLIGSATSKSTVSNIAGKLQAKDLTQFQEKLLKDQYQFLIIDGIHSKVREIGVENRVLLAAVGIKPNGQKEIISARLAESESLKDWQSFLIDLKTRGLSGKQLKLITIDGCAGLRTALKTIYPFIKVQRCIVHKFRNVAARIKRAHKKVCMAGMKRIFTAPNRKTAIARFRQWKYQWQILEERAVSILEKDLHECLTFYQFDERLWKKIRTTNTIERMFREIRRRTRPMSIALSPENTERLFASLAKSINKSYENQVIHN
jgi:putative transposase